MKPFLLLDKSSERIGKFLENLRKAPDIQLYRAIYDQRALNYSIEVVEMTNDVLADENVYYGALLTRLPTDSTAFVVFIPGHGLSFGELVEIACIRKSGGSHNMVVAPGMTDSIKIESPLVTMFRERLQCLPWKKDHFRTADEFWIALYSIGAHKINETDKIITQQPKFESVSTRPILPTSSAGFRLVFDNTAEFKNAIGQAICVELGFEAYSLVVADQKFLLSKLLTWKEAVELLDNPKHPCNRLLEICVLRAEPAPIPPKNTNSKAMTESFLKADQIFTPFRDHVLAAAKVNLKSMIARFFHLTQSSGAGKTTLCLNLINELRTGIYCVYREARSSGFPPTNEWTCLLVSRFEISPNDEEAVKICLAFILAAVESVFTVRQSWKSDDLRTLYVKASTAFGKLFRSKFEEASSKSANDLIKAIRGIDDALLGDCFPIIMDSCAKFLCLPVWSFEPRITLYDAFKRALERIKDQPIVAVFVGNKPLLHHSYKIGGFEPFNFVSSFDVFLPGEIDDVALFDGKIMQTETFKQIALKCESFDTAMKAAVIKLKADKDIATLAAFVMRTGAPVEPASLLAQKLVNCAMARLEGMDCCRVSYGAEPVLASAARLYCGSVDNLNVVLAEFLKCIKNGSVSRVSEEFVARVIALRAIDRAAEVNLLRAGSTGFGSINWLWIIDDRCCDLDSELPKGTQKYPSYVLITLRDFLMNLRGDGMEGLNVSEEMMNGLVNVSQFIRYDRLALKDAFIRCVGLSCSSALIIPVLKSDDCYSAVIIQFNDEPVERLSFGAEYVKVDLCLRGLEAFTHLFGNDSTSASILSSLNSILKAAKRERVDYELPPSTRQRLH